MGGIDSSHLYSSSYWALDQLSTRFDQAQGSDSPIQKEEMGKLMGQAGTNVVEYTMKIIESYSGPNGHMKRVDNQGVMLATEIMLAHLGSDVEHGVGMEKKLPPKAVKATVISATQKLETKHGAERTQKIVDYATTVLTKCYQELKTNLDTLLFRIMDNRSDGG